MKLWTVVLTAMLAFGSLDADAARRLGGGGSFGRQSPNVTQRQNVPPAQPSAPANAAQRNQAQQPGAPGAQAAQVAPRRPWAGMLGGLAAGLGLAWLANSLGLGPMFANFMLVLIVALVAMLVIGAIMRRRRPAAAGDGYAWQGAAPGAVVTPRQYNPEKVGNDASARPWERTSGPAPLDSGRPAGGATGLRIGSGLEGAQGWGVPPGFDTQGFLEAAKRNFVTLQAAWDRGDLSTLRGMMTDEMFAEIRKQLAGRDTSAPYQTEVVMLEAQLLGIEDTGSEYVASVEFSGMIREDPSAGPAPFREVWNMVKPKDGSQGWLVAGVQALQ